MMKLIAAYILMLCAPLFVVGAEIYVVPLKELKFEKKSEELTKLLDGERGYDSWVLRNEPSMSARTPEGVLVFIAPSKNEGEKRGDSLVAIEVAMGEKFSAMLDIPDGYDSGVKSFQFSFDPKKHKSAKKEAFERLKKTHYFLLSKSGYVGTPWFNEMAGDCKFSLRERRLSRDATNFSFYTGGRAISDNLALDRELRLMKNDLDAKVDINSLEGIKTKAIDWKGLMPKEEVAIDSLAMLVPEDQHVLICPSLADMNKIVSLIEKEGSPLAQSFTVRNPFRTLPSKYKKQLGLDFPPAFAKLVPVKSVAVTGYDPFFPTGTDVAVLLEADQPEMLFKMLDKVIKTPDRNIAVVGNAVVISNSKKQLARIQEVHAGKIQSLGSLDEYKFFRHRYPVAEKRTGFVFLSDACIRRWGGPRLRIAASRRTKSVAALNYVTARSLSMGKMVELNDDQKFLLGEVGIENDIIESEKMGSLHFMTPSIDMHLDKVTQTEGDAYLEWKRGYEEGWSKVFDPIGFSFNIDDDTKELDLTVMPLTVNNYYEEFIKIVGKSVLSRDARIAEDEHVMTMSLAIDKDGEMFRGINTSLSQMMPGIKVKPLAWLGSSVTFFAEKDARWKLLENSKSSFENVILGSPIGLRIEHTSQIKLASFLLAVRGTAAAVAPDALKWEARKHGEVTYAVVSSEEDLGLDDDLKIYYLISKDKLTITLREDVLKREIDRQNSKVEKKLALSPVQQNADHVYMKSSSSMLMALSSSNGASLSEMRRKQSYRAIPILNEWKRKFKEVNPVVTQFMKFGEDVFCPGGKGYVWNAEEMTMESVVYGYPSKPKKVEGDGPVMDAFGEIETSMKFEHDGLRINLKISKDEPEGESNTTVISPGTKLLGKLDYPTEPGVKWDYNVSINEGDSKPLTEVETVENVSHENDILIQKNTIFLGGGGDLVKFDSETGTSTKEGMALLYVSSRSGKSATISYSEPVKNIPTKLRLGFKQIQYFTSIFKDAKSTSRMAQNTRVTGVEDVKIREKIYKDCYVVEQELVQVQGGGVFTTYHTTLWLKPAVGVVKYYQKDEFSEKHGELKSITFP